MGPTKPLYQERLVAWLREYVSEHPKSLVHVRKDKPLYRQGERADHVHVVLAGGQFRTVTSSGGGKNATVEIIGEYHVLLHELGHYMLHSAFATKDSNVVRIEKEEFMEIMEGDPLLLRIVFDDVAQQNDALRGNNDDAPRDIRLSRHLLHLLGDRETLLLKPTRLAELAGTTREHAHRTLIPTLTTAGVLRKNSRANGYEVSRIALEAYLKSRERDDETDRR
jgi:CRP-like cAMP-binding protein